MFDWLKRARQSEHDLGQESLSAFLDGELQAGERARVQQHLQECAACRADLEALRQTVALVQAVPQLEPPRSFLLPASARAKQSQVRRLRLSYAYLQVATAVATVLLVLVVSGDALLRYAPARQAQPLPATAVEFMAATPELLLAEEPMAIASEPQLGASEAGKIAAVPGQPPQALAAVATPSSDMPVAAPTEASLAVQDTQALEARAAPSQTFARPACPPPPAPGTTTEARTGQPTALVEPTSQAEPTLVALVTTVPDARCVAERGIPPLAAAPSAQVEAPSAQPSAVGVPTSDTMAVPEVQPTATSESVTISAGVLASPAANVSAVTEVPTVAPAATVQATPLPTMAALPTAMPMPVQTPVPPTATPMPAQAALGLTASPTPQPEVVGPLAQRSAAPAGRSGLRAWLETRRTLLPWMELILGLVAATLLLATLWLRRRARWV